MDVGTRLGFAVDQASGDGLEDLFEDLASTLTFEGVGQGDADGFGVACRATGLVADQTLPSRLATIPVRIS